MEEVEKKERKKNCCVGGGFPLAVQQVAVLSAIKG
jgi:hypothetical protein